MFDIQFTPEARDDLKSVVTIETVGFKIGNLLFIRNQRRDL